MERLIYKISLVTLLLANLFNIFSRESNPILGASWFVWTGLCVYFLVRVLWHKSNRFASLLFLFWIINAVSFILSSRFVYYGSFKMDSLIVFKSITIALFSYYPFYYFAQKGFIHSAGFRKFLESLFIVLIINFFYYRVSLRTEFESDNVVVNQSYLFVQLLPLLFIFFKGKISYILFIISSLIILIGTKRGAIACLSAEILVYLYYLLRYNTYGRKHRGTIFVLAVITLGVGINFISGQDFLSERLLETGSEYDLSGDIRRMRYTTLYDAFFDSNLKEILFGYGFAQTVSICGGLAHQDWVELLIDNGLIGFIPYIFLIISCIITAKQWPSDYMISMKYAMICCVAIWCLMGTFSMVYASRECFLLFMTIGIIQGNYEYHKKIKTVNKISICR